MDATQATVGIALVGVASPIVLGLLGWSLRKNVKTAEDRDAETRKIATSAATKAEEAVREFAETVRREIASSGEATRLAVTALGVEVGKLSGTLGQHGERLAGGDVKIAGLEERVRGLEGRERERGCFPGCAFRDSHGKK